MVKSPLFFTSLLYACSLSALDTQPWMGNAYDFELETAFSYSRFSKVEGASAQPTSSINNRNLLLDMSLTATPSFDVQFEGEFGQTNTINWALRSGALQARLWLLDDISGESPISLTCGVNVRGAPRHFLKSVTTPYASEFNAELTASVGKEWSQGANWLFRTYGFLALGQGNRGYPWTRTLLALQYNLLNIHRFTLFTEGDVGYGPKQHVDVNHFSGWGKYQHQSIDVGASYGCHLSIYGTLTASYAYRVFAHNFPENVNFLMISYSLPFSVF